MNRPRLLDLFCGAGGAAMGYHRAGFDVVGVDNQPMPRYPFEFIQADALGVLAAVIDQEPWEHYEDWFPGTKLIRPFDAVHASPVCKDHSRMKNATKRVDGTGWQIAAIRELLKASGVPWVIENVPGAPMRPDLKLCGCMFGLPGLRRERWFETSWAAFALQPPHHHTGKAVIVTGHGMQGWQYRDGTRHDQDDRRRAMGIDWMNRDELAQAIPPAYTQFIGEQLIDVLMRAA